MILNSINWNPPTLQDAIDNGYQPELQQKTISPGRHKYRCTGCGCFAFPASFDDVRGIDGIDNDFICDGCYTSLERNLVDIDGDGKPDSVREFKRRFIKKQGAPVELQAEIGKTKKYTN